MARTPQAPSVAAQYRRGGNPGQIKLYDRLLQAYLGTYGASRPDRPASTQYFRLFQDRERGRERTSNVEPSLPLRSLLAGGALMRRRGAPELHGAIAQLHSHFPTGWTTLRNKCVASDAKITRRVQVSKSG
jgi:hypothetical protein